MRAESDETELDRLERRVNLMYETVRSRTAADTPLDNIGRAKRNRWLARTLICDGDGNEIDYDELSIKVQDVARDKADELWSDLSELPFLSDIL